MAVFTLISRESCSSAGVKIRNFAEITFIFLILVEIASNIAKNGRSGSRIVFEIGSLFSYLNS